MKSLLEIYSQDTSPDAHGDKGTAHSYIEHYYEYAFKPYRNKNINLLEIGIAQGQSLRMWREYFSPDSRIIGYDIKGTTRKEMRPFGQVLKHHGAIPNKNGPQVRILRLGAADSMNTKTEISREMEMLEMSRNVLEHDAILSTVKNFHQLVKTILSMSQGG